MSQFFKTWTLADINSLGAPIQIYPSFNYTQTIESQRFTNITESGRVNQYKLNGGFFRFNLALDFVNSSDRKQIKTWWRDQTEVRFTTIVSGATITRYVDCIINNINDPFQQYTMAQNNKFDAVITLFSVNDLNTSRGVQESRVYSAALFTLGTSDGILGINFLG